MTGISWATWSLKYFHVLSQIQQISPLTAAEADYMDSQGQILSWEESAGSYL